MNTPPPPVPSLTAAWLKQQQQQQQLQYADNGFEFSSRIMMSAIIAFVLLLLLFIIFHAYNRWLLYRRSCGSPFSDHHSYHHRHHRRRRPPNFVFTFSAHVPPDHSTGRMPKGLNPAVLCSLPIFVFSSLIHKDGLECSVCLCEFEEGEKGRALGGCGHCFHIDCIDLWFQSHSTCPLCRAEVKSPPSVASTRGEAQPSGPVPLGAPVEARASDEELSMGDRHQPEAVETETPESAKPSPPPPPLPPESRFVGLRNFLCREKWVGSSDDFAPSEVDLEVGGCEPQGQEVKR